MSPKLVKWGIQYKRRVYVQIYGKKRAFELLYRLSRCVEGLSVIPLEPKRRGTRGAAGGEAAESRAGGRDSEYGDS